MSELFFSEFKNLKNYIFLYIIILTLLYSIITSILSFSITVTKHIDTVINEYSDKSLFSVRLEDVDFDDDVLVNEFQLNRIFYSYTKAQTFLSGSILMSNSVSQGTVYLGVGNYDIYDSAYDFVNRKIGNDISIICGETYSKKYENGIWISEKISNNLNVYVNDVITFLPYNSDKCFEFKVIGIINNSHYDYDYVLSETALKHILYENNMDCNRNISAFLPDYYTCRKIFAKLDKMSITYHCYMYSYIQNQTEIFYTSCKSFICLSIILAVISSCIFISFYNIIIVRRYKFIGVLKALGLTSHRITILYAEISEIIVLISLIISCPVSFFTNRFLVEEFNNIFKINNIYFTFDFKAFPLALFILNLLFFVVLMYLKNKIDNIDTIDIIREL